MQNISWSNVFGNFVLIVFSIWNLNDAGKHEQFFLFLNFWPFINLGPFLHSCCENDCFCTANSSVKELSNFFRAWPLSALRLKPKSLYRSSANWHCRCDLIIDFSGNSYFILQISHVKTFKTKYNRCFYPNSISSYS